MCKYLCFRYYRDYRERERDRSRSRERERADHYNRGHSREERWVGIVYVYRDKTYIQLIVSLKTKLKTGKG